MVGLGGWGVGLIGRVPPEAESRGGEIGFSFFAPYRFPRLATTRLDRRR